MKRIPHLPPIAPNVAQASKLLSVAVALGCSFGNVSAALADYVPPVDASAPSGDSTSTGTRGCDSLDPQNTITTLAPRQHVGQTANTRPTFVWYVPNTESFLMELQLYKMTPNGRHELERKVQLQTSHGFMSYTLPENEPELAVGERYVWQVVQFCDGDDLAAAAVSSAEIEVVSSPAHLTDTPTTNRIEQANRYAEAGLWYDALALISVPPADASAEAFRNQLLTDLAELEAVYEQMSGSQALLYSEQLKQITMLP